MANNKFLDLNKFKMETVSAVSSNPLSKTPKKSMKKLEKEISITAEDGSSNTASTWFTLLEDGMTTVVQCPISPELHNNGDVNPSCSMNRNGNYLNFNCFGCGSKSSINFGKPKSESNAKKEIAYAVPDFNKNEVLDEVKQGLDTMQKIVNEMVRLLPALERKEKEND